MRRCLDARPVVLVEDEQVGTAGVRHEPARILTVRSADGPGGVAPTPYADPAARAPPLPCIGDTRRRRGGRNRPQWNRRLVSLLPGASAPLRRVPVPVLPALRLL